MKLSDLNENQIGVQVTAKDGTVLAILWQHLDRAETMAALTEDHQGSLGSILSDWNGQWEPAKPNLVEADEYKLVTRLAAGVLD